MSNAVLITDAQTDFGKNLAAVFAREGYEVFSPCDFEKISALDFFAETTDFWSPRGNNFSITSGVNCEIIEETFFKNVIEPMATLEKFLPLLKAGAGKRLFYVSSAEASISATREKSGFAYKMSKAALHQFLQMLRNELAPEGFAFRVFDPYARNVDIKAAAESAFMYITRRRGTENHDPNRDDETNLVIRDAEGRHHPW